jgi:hypothetical protein
MARIETDPNYTTPTFSRATAAADIFKKEDVQNLASAMSTHDHSSGKGLPVARLAASVGLDAAGTTMSGSLTVTGTVTAHTIGPIDTVAGLTVSGPVGMTGDLTVGGNALFQGGTLTLGASGGAQGQFALLHPNGHISRLRGGASGLEFTNSANSAVIASFDDIGNLITAGNLTLATGAGAAIAFGDAQMIAAGSTYIQTNGKLALGVGPNGYRLVLPNIADGNGQVIANDFIKYSSANGKGGIAPIQDPLMIVMDDRVHGVSYTPVAAEPSLAADGGVVAQSSTGYVLGFVAEDWVAVEPSVVAYDADGNIIGMKYLEVLAIVFEAIKNLSLQIQALQPQPPAP